MVAINELGSAAAIILLAVLGSLHLVFCYATVVDEGVHLAGEDLVLDLFSDRHEHVGDVGILLGAHLVVVDAEACSQLVAFIGAHLSIFAVDLVGD